MTYLSSNIPSLNPLHSAFEVGLVSSQIFASLVRLDENNRPVPYLAESFSISDDGLAYTFNLAKNATFHDGKPVTSADVAFSLGLVKELHRFGPQMFGPVETVETPDDHTVIFRLSKRHGPLLVAATTPRQLPIMPKHVYGDGDFMKHPAHKNPVGSGPFVLKEFKTDQYYIVERNPNHFIEGLPHLDQIIYKLVKDKTARRIGLQRDEFQLADASGVMRLTDIDEFKKIDHLALTEMKSVSGSSIVLEFNNREGPLADKAVRQAIAYGIDRAYISDVLHAGYTKPSQGPLPFTNIFDNPDITGYPYDVDKANALLDEAGYPAGDDGIRFELGLIYIGQPFRPDLNSVPGEYIAQTLKEHRHQGEPGADGRLRRLGQADRGVELRHVAELAGRQGRPGGRRQPPVRLRQHQEAGVYQHLRLLRRGGGHDLRAGGRGGGFRQAPGAVRQGLGDPDRGHADELAVRCRRSVVPSQGPLPALLRVGRVVGSGLLEDAAGIAFPDCRETMRPFQGPGARMSRRFTTVVVSRRGMRAAWAHPFPASLRRTPPFPENTSGPT